MPSTRVFDLTACFFKKQASIVKTIQIREFLKPEANLNPTTFWKENKNSSNHISLTHLQKNLVAKKGRDKYLKRFFFFLKKKNNIKKSSSYQDNLQPMIQIERRVQSQNSPICKWHFADTVRCNRSTSACPVSNPACHRVQCKQNRWLIQNVYPYLHKQILNQLD